MTAQLLGASSRSPRDGVEAVLLRLRSHGACSPELASQVRSLGGRVERLPAGAILQMQGDRGARPRYLLEGWATRYHGMSDGRRQIFDFVLPGEGVGVCLRPHAYAATTAALTPVVLADASPLLMGGDGCRTAPEHAALAQLVADADEHRLLGAIVRLGRMSALERLAHLLLELERRLAVIGRSGPNGFPLPATQEVLADVLGLSVVHINRTVQELRRQGVITLARNHVSIQDRHALQVLADM